MKHLSIITIALVALLSTSCSSESEGTNTKRNYDGPIIDMHVHTGKIMGKIIEVLGNPGEGGDGHGHGGGPMGPQLTFEEHREQTYAMFEKYNIVKAMVSGVDFRASEWSEKDNDRIIAGSMIFGIDDPSVESLREAYENGKLEAIGEVGFYYRGMLASDEGVSTYFDLAQELNIPVGYHLMANLSPDNANPSQFDNVLDKYPNLKIYLMHAGWPHIDETIDLLMKYPNLYVDISAISEKDGFEDFLKKLIDMGYGKRIMYGTDQMEDPSIFDTAVPIINNISFLSYDQKADIYYYNAARFLNLSKEEIKMHWKK